MERGQYPGEYENDARIQNVGETINSARAISCRLSDVTVARQMVLLLEGIARR